MFSRPDLLNFSKLHPQQHRSNLGTAFDIAEQKLGVAKILDPEGNLFWHSVVITSLIFAQTHK